jgi:hypothetical protein
MFKRVRCYVTILIALSSTGALLADDLTDASEILCSVSVATLCDAYGVAPSYFVTPAGSEL